MNKKKKIRNLKKELKKLRSQTFFTFQVLERKFSIIENMVKDQKVALDLLIANYNNGMKMETDLAINVDMSELKQTEKQMEHLNELLQEANVLIGELSTKKIKLDVYI